MKNKAFFDIETYPNYCLVSFTNQDLSKFIEFEIEPGWDFERFKKVVFNNTIVGFNSNNFDLPIIYYILRNPNKDVFKIFELAEYIIESKQPGWMTCKAKGLVQDRRVDSFDLMEVAPGVASLKIYGGRLHSRKLQDLPIEPGTYLNDQQKKGIRQYCRNDLRVTKELHDAIKSELTLRETMGKKYRLDLRSKSGAQIAGAVFKHELGKREVDVYNKPKIPKSVEYKMPDWIEFEDGELIKLKSDIENATFLVDQKTGKVKLPKEVGRVVEYQGAKYKVGIGGLHSQEKCQAIVKGRGECFGEFDYDSMYPNIILHQKLYPRHLGYQFLTLYRDMVQTRLKAKREKNKAVADPLKLIINSSFGLFGQKHSLLYSPELLIQTTLTGQLCLLMMIEIAVRHGGWVVSANTDGINVLCDKEDLPVIANALKAKNDTIGMSMAYTPYDAQYSESVNNYIAVKPDGSVKVKGSYVNDSLANNSTNPICTKAVCDFLVKGIPPKETINNATDIRDFISIRTVKGGAVYNGELLGKAIRWYYSTESIGAIHYSTNGNKVPKSDEAKPLMDLTDDIPKDLDRDWYIKECYRQLEKLGVL